MLPTRHIALAGESCSVKQTCVEQVIYWPGASIVIAMIVAISIIIIVILNRRY